MRNKYTQKDIYMIYKNTDCRSLSSKVVSQYSSLLSPMAVDAVYKVLDPARPELCVSCTLKYIYKS